MNLNPSISIVMPCYNGARFLRQAIESCLRQTFMDFELIVVDDASSDDCAEIADEYSKVDPRVKVVCREINGGVSEAFNSGYRIARGRFFTRLAQDDAFAEDALATFVDYLEEHPNIGLLYADQYVMDELGGNVKRINVPDRGEDALLNGNRIGLAVAWRREVWERVGGFNKDFDTSEDYEYWLRVWKQFEVVKCPGVVPLYVRHHAEMGSTRFAGRQELTTLRILREAYPRHVPPFRRMLMRRKAIGRTFLSAAFDFRDRGMRLRTIHRLLRSFVAWPFPYSRTECRTSLVRLKVLLSLMRDRHTSRGKHNSIQ